MNLTFFSTPFVVMCWLLMLSMQRSAAFSHSGQCVKPACSRFVLRLSSVSRGMQLEGGLQPHRLPDQPEESGRRFQDHVEHQQAIIYPGFILF